MSEHKRGSRPIGPQGGPMGFGMPMQKAKDFKGSLKRLLGYLKPHIFNLVIVLIFAIASTVFTIYAPKVTSRAMNKLQDSYMADKMLENLSTGQDAFLSQISKQMSDYQKKAVNEIESQMSMVQEQIKTKISQMMQSGNGNSAPVDAETLKVIQDFIALPMISTINDPHEKAETTQKLINTLAKMPNMGTASSLDPKSIEAMSDILSLAPIDSITESDIRNQTILQFIDITSKLPDMQNGGQTNTTISPAVLASLKEFLALPRLSSLTDADQKANVSQKLLDIMSKIPSDSISGAKASDIGKNVKLTQEQIDSTILAIRETKGEYDFKYIGYIVLVLIGMYIISSIFSLVMGLVMSGVSQKTVRDLRTEVDNKLAKLPLKYFDMHPHGDILSRVTNDIDTISNTLQQSMTQVITSIITILGYIIMMLTISPVLTLIVLATLPLYVISTVIIAKKSQKYFSQQQKELGLLSGHVEEMYTGHKIVKAFGHEKDSIKKFEDINDKLYVSGWKAQFVSGVMFPLMNFISNLGYVFICIVGGIYITNGVLKLGDILAFIQYSRSFTMPIVQTANIANIIQSTVACAERVFEILDEEEETPDSEHTVNIESPKGEVCFDHVAFSYKEDVPLIRDLNLDIKSGQMVAIVGPTGAGKTTLVNLLMRFYEINSGKISVDGIDINDLKHNDLRSMFGMVLQDTWLFNGTISENIAYGKNDATAEEIRTAADTAYADHFIRTLPDGYNTILNEEASNISQGQKQLLTIARAVLADPAILILDEATSSVDTRTELLIQKAMKKLMKGRTSFVIAHRLSTIRDADIILVMKNGDIIETGTHHELLQKGGFYYELYNSQFAGNNLESA